MNREIQTIKLSSCEVDIYSQMTWGEKEQINATLIDGAEIDETGLKKFRASAMIDVKYKSAELMIKEIRSGEKENVKYSKEWLDNLSPEDGDTLLEAIGKITEVKKK